MNGNQIEISDIMTANSILAEGFWVEPSHKVMKKIDMGMYGREDFIESCVLKVSCKNLKIVEGTADICQFFPRYMHVNHRCLYRFMPQQPLNISDVNTRFNQVCGK